MKTLLRDQMDEIWDEFWNEMSQEWFKVEVLQDYAGEDEGPSLQSWLKGDKQRSIKLLKSDEDPEFTAECKEKVTQGVRLLRVHVVEYPLSPYMEWEMEHYKHVSIPLRSEQVFIVNRSDLGNLELPKGDLMIFDKRRAIVNSYDQNGLMQQADFYNEHDDISQFLELEKALKAVAQPL